MAFDVLDSRTAHCSQHVLASAITRAELHSRNADQRRPPMSKSSTSIARPRTSGHVDANGALMLACVSACKTLPVWRWRGPRSVCLSRGLSLIKQEIVERCQEPQRCEANVLASKPRLTILAIGAACASRYRKSREGVAVNAASPVSK